MKKHIALSLLTTAACCALGSSQAFASEMVSGKVSAVTQSGYEALISKAGLSADQSWHIVVTGGGFVLLIDPPHPLCN